MKLNQFKKDTILKKLKPKQKLINFPKLQKPSILETIYENKEINFKQENKIDWYGERSCVFNCDQINYIDVLTIPGMVDYQNSLRPVIEYDLMNFDYFQDFLDIQHYPLPLYDVNGVQNIFIFYTYNALN